MNWKCDYCTSINFVVYNQCTQCNAPKSAKPESFIRFKSPVTGIEFSKAIAKADWEAINLLVAKSPFRGK